MNKLKTHIITLTSLLLLSLPTMGLAFVNQSSIENSEKAFPVPVPADSDVLKNLGRSSRFQLPPRRIKFLVWNLHKGSEKTFKIEYLTLGFDRDIIMNQEVFLDKNMTDVWHNMSQFLFTTATSFYSGKEKIRTGVANVSKVKPILSDFLRTVTLEPVIHSPKVLLINSYPIRFSNKNLTVVNIHGINFVSTKSFELEFSRIYEKIKDIPSPLVFAGDFNTWNNERLKILDRYAKKLGLSGTKFTPDERMKFNGNPLDHFLHTSDLIVKRARVDGFYSGSDHKPLQVEVEYSPTTNNEPDQLGLLSLK
jgi:endonuclease/exonuclease/phosphatase (EEP) superfamily protein YafD